jgi:hypothetical protein
MFCHHCGHQLPDRAKFCSRCGQEQIPELLTLEPVHKNEPVEHAVISPTLQQDTQIGSQEAQEAILPPAAARVSGTRSSRKRGRAFLILSITILIAGATFFGVRYYLESAEIEKINASRKSDSEKRKKFVNEKNKVNNDADISCNYGVAGPYSDILVLSSGSMTNEEIKLQELYGYLDKYRELGFSKVIYRMKINSGGMSVLDSVSLEPGVRKKK